jgi:hypothetical protein
VCNDCLAGEAVPPICEGCYCPVHLAAEPLGYQVSRTWPGTHGLPVFFHKPCYQRATAGARSWPRARNGWA